MISQAARPDSDEGDAITGTGFTYRSALRVASVVHAVCLLLRRSDAGPQTLVEVARGCVCATWPSLPCGELAVLEPQLLQVVSSGRQPILRILHPLTKPRNFVKRGTRCDRRPMELRFKSSALALRPHEARR